MKTFSSKEIIDRAKKSLNLSSDNELAERLNVSKATLSNWKNRNSLDFPLLFSICEHVNYNWLLTGKGDMLKNDTPPPLEAAVQPIYQPYNPEKKVDNQIINLYDFEATAGLRSLLDNRHANIIDTIKIPNMPKCDGAIHIVGDSMYPRLKPGDIIFYKELPIDLQSILYGEMYLLSYSIDGDDYCVVKYIKRSDKGEPFITLASHNPAHEDTDIDFRCVNAIALIKGSYNQTTMS